MENGEQIAVVFDKEGIDEVGLNFERAVAVVEAFRLLVEHSVKFRAARDPATTSVGTLPRAFEIILMASPLPGSIRLKLWGTAAIGVLSIAANASQVSGISLRDAFSAISATRGEQVDDDPITSEFVRDRETNLRINNLFKAAVRTECSYVAVERGNEVAVLIGGVKARLALIATRKTDHDLVSAPPTLWTSPREVIEVFYRGRSYPAFAVDGRGGSYTDDGQSKGAPVAVLVWASQVPYMQKMPHSLRVEEIEPAEVSHDAQFPDYFMSVSKVYLVTGAAELDYR